MSIYSWLKKHEDRAEKKRINTNQKEAARIGEKRAISKIYTISEKIVGEPIIYFGAINTLDNEQIKALEKSLKEEIISFFKRQNELLPTVPVPTNDTLKEIDECIKYLEDIAEIVSGGYPQAREMRYLFKMVEKCNKVLDDKNRITRRKWRNSCKNKTESSTAQKDLGNSLR